MKYLDIEILSDYNYINVLFSMQEFLEDLFFRIDNRRNERKINQNSDEFRIHLWMVRLYLYLFHYAFLYFSIQFKREINFIIKMYFLFDVMKGSKHLKRVVAMIFLFQKYICAGDFPFEST